MPRKQLSEQPQALEPNKGRAPNECEALNARIGKAVIRALGDPHDLLRVQVRQVWEDHYRVNVLVGANAACARVAHSYFLGADSNGAILTSTPKITKQYGISPTELPL